jgi:hypothetical protein
LTVVVQAGVVAADAVASGTATPQPSGAKGRVEIVREALRQGASP